MTSMNDAPTLSPNYIFFVDFPAAKYQAGIIEQALTDLSQRYPTSLQYLGRDRFDTRNRGFLIWRASASDNLINLVKDYFADQFPEHQPPSAAVYEFLRQYTLAPIDHFNQTDGSYTLRQREWTYQKNLGPIDDDGNATAQPTFVLPDCRAHGEKLVN